MLAERRRAFIATDEELIDSYNREQGISSETNLHRCEQTSGVCDQTK